MGRWLRAVLVCLFAVAPDAAAAPKIAGKTVVQAPQPAYLDVELDRGYRFFGSSTEQRPRMKVEGDASFAMLSLRSMEHVDGRPARAVEYVHIRVDRDEISGSTGHFTCPCEDEPVVPAGRYRLYLHADAPVKVTLRLPELDGETALRPSAPAPFMAAPLASLPTGAPWTTVLGRWGEQPTDDGRMHMLARFEGGADPTADRTEACLLTAEREADGDDAFGPGCSGNVPTPFDVVPLGDGSWALWMSTSGFPKGRYGLGANLTHAGEAVRGGGITAFAGYADHEPPLDPGEQAPEPGPPAAPAPAGPATGTLSLTSPRARVRGRRAHVRVRCGGPGPCRGTAALAGGKQVPVTSLSPGRRTTLRLPLSRAHRRALRKRSSLRARLLLRTQQSGRVSERRLRVRLLR